MNSQEPPLVLIPRMISYDQFYEAPCCAPCLLQPFLWLVPLGTNFLAIEMFIK